MAVTGTDDTHHVMPPEEYPCLLTFDVKSGALLKQQWYDEQTDRTCVVLKLTRRGYYCGYVRTTVPHDQYQQLEDHVSVHGSVSYRDEHWVGFDTHHALDNNVDEDGKPFGRFGDLPWSNDGEVTTWAPEDAYEETERLADEVDAFEHHHSHPPPGHPEDDGCITTVDPDDPPNDGDTTA